MKKRTVINLLSLCLILCMIGGICVNAETVELGGLSFTTFGGEWTFDDTGFSLVGDGPSGWPKIITNTTYQHFTIEADFVGVKEGGFVFRCGDPGVGADAFDGYFVGYDSAYAYFGIDTGKWKTLNEGGPDATAAAPLKYKERMHWKLTVSGNVYTLYVDDMENPLIQTFDNTFDRAGGVGIRICAKAGEEAGRVENIVINGIPVDEVTYNEKGTYDLWAERLINQYPAKENQGKIILMGHSFIEFWRNSETDLLPYDTLNFGMGGSWVRHIANKTAAMLVPYNPKAVIIGIGGNDVSGGVPTAQIISEVQAYIESLLTDLPGVPIIYVSNVVSSLRLTQQDQKTARLQINDEMKPWCDSKENVWYLDCTSAASGENPDIWLADQIHMNATGYQQAAPLFLEKLDEIFSEDTPEPTQPQETPAPQNEKPDLIPWICGGIIAAAVIAVAVVLLGENKKKDDGKGRE